MVGVLTGRVIQFNQARGFGFIEPDSGGEDVFLHIEEIRSCPGAAEIGARVRFQALESQRGYKAFNVSMLDAPRQAEPQTNAANADADEFAEVISARRYTAEVTDLLISSCPDLTAGQIADIRDRLATAARKRRWLED